MESLAEDLSLKGYPISFTETDKYTTQNSIPEFKAGAATISIYDDKFTIRGVGILFNDIDISDSLSIDRLYLAIDVIYKIDSHLRYVNDKTVDHVERIRRKENNMEIQAKLLSEYYLAMMRLENGRR